MSKSNKSAFMQSLFGFYSRNLIRRRFLSLKVANFASLAQRDSRIPLVISCNHTSWWDGLIVFQLLRLSGLDGFILMEDTNLRKYPLFRKLGAVPISRDKPRAALRSLRATAELVQTSAGRAAVIFPQGKILPFGRGPIVFESGIARLVKYLGICDTVAIAVRLEFGAEFKPEIFVRCGPVRRFGESDSSEPRTNKKILFDDFSLNLRALAADVAESRTTDYETVL